MTKPKRTLTDTNTILRYLLKDNKTLYEKSNVFFEKVRLGEKKAVILESVLVECTYVLMKFYQIPKEEVTSKLIDLLHYKGIANSDKKELIDALKMFKEHKKDIVDCILWTKSLNYNMSVFSFDKHLKKCKNTMRDK